MSAICFNLDQSKILLSDNGLRNATMLNVSRDNNYNMAQTKKLANKR